LSQCRQSALRLDSTLEDIARQASQTIRAMPLQTVLAALALGVVMGAMPSAGRLLRWALAFMPDRCED
jgi:hypothetical protein